MQFRSFLIAGALGAGVIYCRSQVSETFLSGLLPDNSGWEIAAQGYQFTDATCADAAGNFYFTDVARGTNIFRISPDSDVAAVTGNAENVSGLKVGPNGWFYACQGKFKRVIRLDREGSVTVLATNVEPNDLVVTSRGGVYFTETGSKQIEYIDPQGGNRVVDKGVNAPNGIALSPDERTLAVSEYSGHNVWTFSVQPDGSLTGREPYMDMRVPAEGKASQGDGMTADKAGRYYVCTAVGVQVFDPTGRLCAVLPKPQAKALVNVALAGRDHSYLYVACGDKIYRRKTTARGIAAEP
jgi:gluconolactonase